MITNATISNEAMIRTRISDASFFCNSSLRTISAFLYQLEKKLTKMAITSTTASGSPRESCLKTFRRLSLFSFQNSTNAFSSELSITGAKLWNREIPLAAANQNIYIVGLKSITLKLAPLLAQFLYANKRLDLIGIGSFSLDPSAVMDPGAALPTPIYFENNPSIRESPDLVNFISGQTGKMKALAAADLNSHLELIQEFLNIGKPFQLDGIGSLVKIRSGEYEFKAGELLAEKIKDLYAKEATSPEEPEGSFATYKPFLEKEKRSIAWQKPAVALLILVGIGLAVLGGYVLYKRNNPAQARLQPQEEQPPVTRTAIPATEAPAEDSFANRTAAASYPGHYKYVLETAGKKRAMERFNKLKLYQWDVHMETADSLRFKLFLLLPTPGTDTTRVRDSLTALNGRKVYIEYN